MIMVYGGRDDTYLSVMNTDHSLIALVEPLAVGWHPRALSEMRVDAKVLILGGGPICLAAL